MSGNNGWGGASPCLLLKLLRLTAGVPATEGGWTRGDRDSNKDLAPETLTRGLALHAPAAAAALGQQPPATPPLAAALLGTALSIPRAPLPPSLFMAVSKLQPPLEQLRPLMGTRQ